MDYLNSRTDSLIYTQTNSLDVWKNTWTAGDGLDTWTDCPDFQTNSLITQQNT